MGNSSASSLEKTKDPAQKSRQTKQQTKHQQVQQQQRQRFQKTKKQQQQQMNPMAFQAMMMQAWMGQMMAAQAMQQRNSGKNSEINTANAMKRNQSKPKGKVRSNKTAAKLPMSNNNMMNPMMMMIMQQQRMMQMQQQQQLRGKAANLKQKAQPESEGNRSKQRLLVPAGMPFFGMMPSTASTKSKNIANTKILQRKYRLKNPRRL